MNARSLQCGPMRAGQRPSYRRNDYDAPQSSDPASSTSPASSSSPSSTGGVGAGNASSSSASDSLESRGSEKLSGGRQGDAFEREKADTGADEEEAGELTDNGTRLAVVVPIPGCVVR